MNDFELQRHLRTLNAPRAPQADLWPGIASRIAAEASTPVAQKRWQRWPLAVAAAALFAVVGISLMLGLRKPSESSLNAMTAVPLPAHAAMDFARAPGGDPRLVGAAVVLDAAHAELEQALEQRPDAVFLVGLLNRTNARRMKLDHFGANAG